MKLYIIGHKGWIGNMYVQECIDNNIAYYHSDYRAGSSEIKKDILDKKATHVLCCMGRTHGTFNDKTYTTIDFLEHKEILPLNINDNLYAPMSLSLFCEKMNIHFTYIGTGCIYEYDDAHLINSGIGFKETDSPNFSGSNYSIVKGFTNNLMIHTEALHLRIRMPITNEQNARNFITKITTYEKICSMPNSMTVLTELIPLSIQMMMNNETGTFNFTNPGTISHNEILEMYTEIVDPTFTWKNFTIDEQDEILLGKRSNNLLDTSKLESKYEVLSIHDSVKKCLLEMKSLVPNINISIKKKSIHKSIVELPIIEKKPVHIPTTQQNKKDEKDKKDVLHEIEDFLHTQCRQIKESGHVFNYLTENNKVAVIIEPREHKLLEAVIRNVMHHLGPEWNLHVFGNRSEYVQKLFPNCTYKFSSFGVDNITPVQYNNICTGLNFWHGISEENVLIFQTDSFIMNKIPNLEKYLQYPFIGGVYHYYMTPEIQKQYSNQIAGYTKWTNSIEDIHLHNTPIQNFSINGGFSFRKKSAMIHCIQNVTKNDILEYRKKHNMNNTYYTFSKTIGEDTYFHNALEILGYSLPSVEECNIFCNNLSYPTFNKDSFSIHNINKKNCIVPFTKDIMGYIKSEEKKYTKKNIINFKNCHKNKDIYVIASGKSIDFIDNSFFKDKILIGINQVYKKIQCNYLVRKEQKLIDQIIKDNPNITHFISQYDCGIGKKNNVNIYSDNVVIYEHNINKEIVPTNLPKDGQLLVSWSTITTGLHLAAYMGAKNIILIGHDCGTINGEANFLGYHTDSSYKIAHKNGKEDYIKWLKNIESGTLKVRKLLKEKYKCNIYSINPFINFGLEGNIYKN